MLALRGWITAIFEGLLYVTVIREELIIFKRNVLINSSVSLRSLVRMRSRKHVAGLQEICVEISCPTSIGEKLFRYLSDVIDSNICV